MTQRTRGQRAGLTRAGVLAAGRDLLAERGLQALTMRALADRLQVAPNTLYSHVEGKLELVDALLDDALQDIAAPAADVAEPLEGLRDLMVSTYDVLLRNPDLIALYLTRQGSRGSNAQRLGAVMFALLERLHVPEPVARQVLRVLIVYTIGSAAFTTEPEPTPIHTDDLRASFTQGLDWLLRGIISARPVSTVPESDCASAG